MNILRKIGVSLCAMLLSLSLFGIAWSNVSLSTIRNRTAVKGWLDKSGFYTKVADVVLEKAKVPNPNGSQDTSVPVDDPQVQAVVKDVFTPAFLRENVEKFLDGSYNWMDGTSSNLNFTLDLTSSKEKLATGLADYATAKAAALPVCATNEPIDSFDAFKAVCRPRALTPAAVGQKVKSDMLSSGQFLENPIVTTNDLKIDGVPIDKSEAGDVARKTYQLSGFAPLIFGVLSLIAAAGIIMLSSERLKGVKRVGHVLLVTGIILLVIYAGLGAMSDFASRKLAENPEAGAVAQSKLIADTARIILNDVRKSLVVYAVGYTVLGIIAMVTALMLKKRRGDDDSKPSKDETSDKKPQTDEKVLDLDSEPAQPEEPTPAKKPRPKKIQL